VARARLLWALNLDVGVDGEVLLRALGEVVDAGVLDDRGEHEEEAHEQEDVERRRVGDLGDAGATRQTQRTRRQQRRYTCTTDAQPPLLPLAKQQLPRDFSVPVQVRRHRFQQSGMCPSKLFTTRNFVRIFRPYDINYYSVPETGAEYCDDRVCLCLYACAPVREHISGNTRPIFTNFSCMLPWLGPPLAALRYVMYFRFHR